MLVHYFEEKYMEFHNNLFLLEREVPNISSMLVKH
jgi:hypothetical protein